MPRFRPLQLVMIFVLIISSSSAITPVSPVFSKLDDTSLPVGSTVVLASLAQAGTTSALMRGLALMQGITSITAGGDHTCALTSVGGVKCWGRNDYGQLGDGTTTQRLTPVDVSGLTSGVITIAAGYLYTCAVTSMGSVKCWGDNSWGQLGDGTTTNRLTPVNVSGLTSGITAVALRHRHTCALTSTGGVKCWGENYSGQLGDGTTTNRLTPVNVSGLTSGVKAIAVGGSYTCARTNADGVKCWGWNYSGQLGDGTTTTRLTPVNVSGLTSGVTAIATGMEYTCALISTGGVKCWGYNGSGQLGNGTTTDRLTPTNVSGLTNGVTAITAGHIHACALTSTGGVKCWGANYSGQLGDGTTTTRLTPVNVGSLTSTTTMITAGVAHTCARTNADGAKCWGDNYYGQLGDGTTAERHTPVDVIEPTTPVVQEARLDIGMPYNTNRGCSSPYVGCGGPYHGFYNGVCTDLAMDAYNAGVPFNIQSALYQDHLAHPGRYRYGTARNADDMRRYFNYNQQFLSHAQAYQSGDTAFFDWDGNGLTDHVNVISVVDANGRPLKMVDATGTYSGNPSGLAFEHNWSTYYDQHIQGHGRLNSAYGATVASAASITETLQVLRVTVDSPSVALRLRDAHGKSTSDTYDENLVASNIEAFIPYIPGGVYADSGTDKVISVTQPLSNTAQYFIEVTGNTAAQYQLEIQTLQDGAFTASTSFTQSIALSETQGITLQLSAPGGVITFTASTPVSTPTVGVSPTEIQMSGQSDITATAAVMLTETGSQQAFNGVSVDVSNLMNQAGQVITGTLLTVAPASFDVPAGGSQGVQLEMDLASMEPGVYQGSLVISPANGGTRAIPLSLSVEPFRVFLPLTLKNVP